MIHAKVAEAMSKKAQLEGEDLKRYIERKQDIEDELDNLILTTIKNKCQGACFNCDEGIDRVIAVNLLQEMEYENITVRPNGIFFEW